MLTIIAVIPDLLGLDGWMEVALSANVRWERAQEAAPPPAPPPKVFVPKFDIPVLKDYSEEVFPSEYWDAWPVFPLSEAKVQSWVDVEALKGLCVKAGIPIDTGLAAEVLHDLEFGADIGARGRSRLPTWGKNGKTAFQYGERVQDTLASFIKKGIYVGPLKMEELEGWSIKVHPLTVRLKDDGSVRVIVDASYPYVVEPEGVQEDEPASLNAFINGDDFPAYMDGLGEFVELLNDQGKGSRIFKADLEAAYKHVPVRKEDWPLQVLAWGDRLFIDLKLMFGTVSIIKFCKDRIIIISTCHFL